jgi:hypothetical protein
MLLRLTLQSIARELLIDEIHLIDDIKSTATKFLNVHSDWKARKDSFSASRFKASIDMNLVLSYMYIF